MSFGPISLPSSGGGADPTALKILQNLADLDSVPTAQTNLGLGVLAVGDDAADVPYTPATPAYWLVGVPSEADVGLDNLAQLLFGLYNVATANGQDEGSVLVANGDDTASWTPIWPEVTLASQSTGNVAASGGTADVDIALPSGVTRFLITEIQVTRTAGTGTSMSASVFSDDARTLNEQLLIGSGFGGVTVDPGPLYGPSIAVSADFIRSPVPYRNTESDEFVRLEVTNQDGSNDATYTVVIRGIPLRAFP